jgi:hypothetical protein
MTDQERLYPQYPLNIETSLVMLGFTESEPKTIQELNKRYHMLALKHHPDKNDHNDEVFKAINNAHKCVKDYLFSGDRDHDDESIGNSGSNYTSILEMFVKSLLFKLTTKTNISPQSSFNRENVNSIIQTILNKGVQSAVLLFRNMDKHSCLSIYDILSANHELFSISREILNEMHDIVESKIENDTIINLNPTITDMLLDKVYILREHDHAYYIPLWHSQLHFKKKFSPDAATDHGDNPIPGESASALNDSELIVLCNPELPDNITIDEHNNIYIHDFEVDICELFTKQVVMVSIDDISKGRGFIYELRARDVCFNSDTPQHIRLHGSYGLARVNSQDIYNVSKRSHVYAIVRLSMKQYNE